MRRIVTFILNLMKNRDGFTIGAVSGILAGIPMALMEPRILQVAHDAVLPGHPLEDVLSYTMAVLAHIAFASLLGAGLYYILRLTGKHDWWIKGTGYGITITWLVARTAVEFIADDHTGMPEALLGYASHALWGFLAAWLIIKFDQSVRIKP
jgi:hypothetical protein